MFIHQHFKTNGVIIHAFYFYTLLNTVSCSYQQNHRYMICAYLGSLKCSDISLNSLHTMIKFDVLSNFSVTAREYLKFRYKKNHFQRYNLKKKNRV